MAAWRLLDHLRRGVIISQAWLEQRIQGWGNESDFTAVASFEVGLAEEVPEHWAELVRQSAPWLLRPTRKDAAGLQQSTPPTRMPSHSVVEQSHDIPEPQQGAIKSLRPDGEMKDVDVDSGGKDKQLSTIDSALDQLAGNRRTNHSSSRPGGHVPLHQDPMWGNADMHYPAHVSNGEWLEETENNEPDYPGELNKINNHVDLNRQKGANAIITTRDKRSYPGLKMESTLAIIGSVVTDSEPFYDKKRNSSPIRETSGRGQYGVTPFWPRLPGEEGDITSSDHRWPSLEPETNTAGDDTFVQKEGWEQQWNV